MTMQNEGASPLEKASETLGNDPAARNPDGSLKDPGAEAAKAKEGEKPELNADGTPKAKEGEAKKPAAWKEYENDPAKTAEENAAAKAEHDKTKPAEGAPEKYDIKPPEGTKLDEKAIETLTPIFKKYNLPNEAAQELFDFHVGQLKAIGEASIAQYEAMRTGWRDTVVKDTTLGNGKDDMKTEVKATLGRFIDALPNAKAFREAMDLTGAGDHPAFVSALFHVASKAIEGQPVRGAGPSKEGQKAPGSGPASPATALYPNLPSSNAGA